MAVIDLRPESRARRQPLLRFGESDALPFAVLRMKVIEAARLRGADWALFGKKRSSDPYCVVRFGAEKHCTHVIEKTLDPVWNQCFDMLLFDWKQRISLDIYDYDFAKSDDLLGKVKAIPCLRLLQTSFSKGLWLPVDDDNAIGDEGPLGSQILVAAEAMQLRADSADLHDLVAQITTAHEVSGEGPSLLGKCSMTFVGETSEHHGWGCRLVSGLSKTHLTAQSHHDAEHKSSVAMFVFRVLKARIPQADAPNVADASVRITIGNVSASGLISPRDYKSCQSVPVEVQDIIKGLTRSRLSDREILHAVSHQLDETTVVRLIEKGQGFNGEMHKSMYILPTAEDLEKAVAKAHISVELLVKGAAVAHTYIPIRRFADSQGSRQGLVRELLRLPRVHDDPSDSEKCAQLDVQASLYVLKPYSSEVVKQLAEKVLEPHEHQRSSVTAPWDSSPGPPHFFPGCTPQACLS